MLTRIRNNVERGGANGFSQLHSTFVKTKERLNGCCKNSFNVDSTSFQHVSTGLKGASKRFQHGAVHQNRPDVETNVETVCLGVTYHFQSLN